MLMGARGARLAAKKKPYWGLCFTAEEAGVVVNMSKTGSPPAVTLETSRDGMTWETFDVDGGTTPITLAKAGDHVYFRAGSAGNLRMASSSIAYRRFTLSARCAASGNIMSLLSATDPDVGFASGSGYAFSWLFYHCTSLTAAPALPARTLADDCYYYMFSGCTSLTAAPALPARTLAGSCYNGMFSHCKSLTAAPELPARTLAQYCYFAMFYGCTSLPAAPALPARTLAGSCYSSMFSGCTSLTAAPELPARTLAGRCYSSMFSGCTSLTAAPELPARTLADDCYSFMFKGCTSLTAAPELPATTLAQYCYYDMFRNCTSLREVEVAFSAWTPANAITNWLSGVSSTGTFRCPTALGTDTTITRGGSNCPVGWTVVNTD